MLCEISVIIWDLIASDMSYTSRSIIASNNLFFSALMLNNIFCFFGPDENIKKTS